MQSLQNWQVVSNMTRRIWWIFIQPLKSKKKSIWWAIFSNFVEKMTFGSKNDMRNLVICNASSGKSENLHFDLLLLSISYKVSVKKVQKNSLMTLKKDPNFEKKLTFCFKNDMRKSEKFNMSCENFENLHFNGLFL